MRGPFTRNCVARMMLLFRLVQRLLVVAMLVSAVPAMAQSIDAVVEAMEPGAGDPAQAVTENREKIAAIGKRADQLSAQMELNTTDDGVLVEIRSQLEGLNRDLIASGVAFRPRLTAINARLDEIGPTGEDEPSALTVERQNLAAEKTGINTLLGEAEGISLRINGMIEEIARVRRELFSNTLSRRYDIGAAFTQNVLRDIATETATLNSAVTSWLRFVFNYKLSSLLLATFFALVPAGALVLFGRRIVGRLFDADPANHEPSYMSRLSVTFWSTLLPTAALCVFLGGTWFFYNYYGILRRDIAEMMSSLFKVIAIVFFVYRLASAIFSPKLPAWRLLPIRTPAAKALFWLVCLTAVVTAADFFGSRVNEVMRSPLSLTVAKSFVATVIVGVLLIIIGLVKPYEDENGQPKAWHPLFRLMLYLLGGGMIVAAILGYIGLARFISQQIVVTGAILTTMYVGHLSGSAVSEIGAFNRSKIGRKLNNRFKFDETTEDQIGLMLSIVINVLVFVIGIPLILLQWGFQWGDISSWTYNVANEIRIGSISISLIGLVTGVFVFMIGYFGTRAFQRWLDGKVMARGRVDAGVRNSVGTAVGYAGVSLAGLIGLSAAGIDLSNLALVAGALSLGIGFGLQNIVNNFVSGLILLAERPFKVGDWIVAGGFEGNVRKISVRATEIETFQRQTVIMPNSQFINAAVGNWTHRNRLGRVDVAVVAAYTNDPRAVHKVLLEIVSEHPQTLRNPSPSVSFDGFTDVALNFTVRAFVADITSTGAFKNELRFQIVERFKAEGITTTPE